MPVFRRSGIRTSGPEAFVLSKARGVCSASLAARSPGTRRPADQYRPSGAERRDAAAKGRGCGLDVAQRGCQGAQGGAHPRRAVTSDVTKPCPITCGPVLMVHGRRGTVNTPRCSSSHRKRRSHMHRPRLGVALPLTAILGVVVVVGAGPSYSCTRAVRPAARVLLARGGKPSWPMARTSPRRGLHQPVGVLDESGGAVAVERRFAHLLGELLRRLPRYAVAPRTDRTSSCPAHPSSWSNFPGPVGPVLRGNALWALRDLEG